MAGRRNAAGVASTRCHNNSNHQIAKVVVKLEQNRSVLHLCANRQLNKQFTRAPLKAAHFPTNRRQQTGGWLLARPSSTFGSGGDHPQPRTLQLCPSSGLASLNSGEGTFKGDTAAKCVVVCSSSARASGTRGVRIDFFQSCFFFKFNQNAFAQSFMVVRVTLRLHVDVTYVFIPLKLCNVSRTWAKSKQQASQLPNHLTYRVLRIPGSHCVNVYSLCKKKKKTHDVF